MIAGGLGSFEPRKPIIENLSDFEQNGVNYIVKDPDPVPWKRNGYLWRWRFGTRLGGLFC